MSTQQKLSALLAMPGWTQAKIAERLGVSQSTVNRWKQGTSPEGDHRDALSELYAEVYGYSSGERMMRVRGYVGHDQVIHFVDRADQGWIERPPTDYPLQEEKLTAITVRGDGMSPHFDDRWVVFFADACAPKEVVGEIVVAHTIGGEMLLKRLRRGDKEDRWTLTYPGAADIVDVELEAASPLIWIKPYTWRIPF